MSTVQSPAAPLPLPRHGDNNANEPHDEHNDDDGGIDRGSDVEREEWLAEAGTRHRRGRGVHCHIDAIV